MIKLRDYQQLGADSIKISFSKGNKKLILQSPTGSGKTIIFSYIAQNTSAKGKKVLILTDRTELLSQTGGALAQFGIQPYLIRSGTRYINFNSNVYVAMCETLRNRLKLDIWKKWLKDIDLVVIDECHRQNFNYLFESGLVDDKFVIGFTATPKRSGSMRQLALDYEEIIETISVSELIRRGYLVADDYYGVGGVDLNNIKYDKLKGDYSESEMFGRFNSPKLYAGVVKNWKEVANNTHTIVFCVNIEHCIHTCEEFRKNGIDARFVTSKMGLPKEPKKDDNEGMWVRYREKMRLYNLYLESHSKWSGNRTEIFKQFANKEFPVLINAGIATTGYDCPSIETVIINRATTSVTLWLQMIGRGSRIFKNKTHFNILDFGDNANRLGHYQAPQHWSLWHSNEATGEGVPPVKVCGENMGLDKNQKKGCNRMIMASYKICPLCGYMYPEKKAKDIDLKGVMYDNERHLAVSVKKISEMDVNELYDYFKVKGHKPAWLWRQLYFRGGVSEIEKFGAMKNWKNGTVQKAVEYVRGL